ncbi:MAG: ATP-binding protein [Prolixibacteraceae bacterium]|nr:ATP-binding protein [Prolixibacteraceae bacterium]MBN2650187.1 ATP-binding protein [Prolixibacteraceae bacterium]
MDNQWYKRYLESSHHGFLKKGKVSLLYGPRRVGKTELIKKIISNYSGRIFTGTGDNVEISELLSSQRLSQLEMAFGNYQLIFIDEAQRIPNIGHGLKLLIDSFPDITIIASGSSSFDLFNKTGEPLTGRQITRTLYPISVMELHDQFGGMDVIQKLESLLIYGSYPEVLTNLGVDDKKEYLTTIRNSYLFKDILELDNIKNPSKLTDLLRLLAYQIGHEVSINELSNNLGISKHSVERLLDLLEKTFIIKKVGGFSRNLRKEITKTSRYYFWDNGIRNALINNFNALNTRNDTGMLWENFLFMERIKTKAYKRIYSNDFFWRTYDRQEIDLIEERDGNLFAYEFKWNKPNARAPKAFINAYPDALFKVISKDNFLEFLV